MGGQCQGSSQTGWQVCKRHGGNCDPSRYLERHHEGDQRQVRWRILPRRTIQPGLSPDTDGACGLDATTAEMQVKLAGFSAGVELEPVASSQPIGTVAYTVPAAGESVPKGTLVKIFISSGGATLMPDVSGMDIDVAEGILEGLGLITSLPQPSQGWLYNKCNTALPEGVVFGTDPAAGTEVANASAVVLIPNNCRGNGNEG